MKKNLNSFTVFVFILLLITTKGKAQTATYFYGEFKIRKVLNYFDSLSTTTNYIALSNLYADSVPASKSYTAINVGQVIYSTKGLGYTSQIKTYMDTVIRKTNTGINWALVGVNGNTSFTTTLVDSFPSYNFKTSLPTQLDKLQNFCIVLNNCKYTDEVEVTFFDGQYRFSVPYYRKVNFTTNLTQIIIPKCDLSTLTGSGVHVTISLIKNEYKKFNGKRYKFEKRFDYVRPMAIVN